jgi:hypothetical protein
MVAGLPQGGGGCNPLISGSAEGARSGREILCNPLRVKSGGAIKKMRQRARKGALCKRLAHLELFSLNSQLAAAKLPFCLSSAICFVSLNYSAVSLVLLDAFPPGINFTPVEFFLFPRDKSSTFPEHRSVK